MARTDQERFGKIFRRNIAYGTLTRHGTIFVGFSADQRILQAMLESVEAFWKNSEKSAATRRQFKLARLGALLGALESWITSAVEPAVAAIDDLCPAEVMASRFEFQ